MLKGRELVA